MTRASDDLNHSVHVRHLIAVPQPEPVGNLLLTEEQARELSIGAVAEILADTNTTVDAETRELLEATWLTGALWGIGRARKHIQAMTP